MLFCGLRLRGGLKIGKPVVAIVGAGKVGSALGFALKNAGYPICGVASRTLSSAQKLGRHLICRCSDQAADITAEAELIFITTPDREVTAAAKAIADGGGFKKGQIAAHTSGSLPASAIEAAKKSGAYIASFHPLQSFADMQTAINNLPGSYFALEGEEQALESLKAVVKDLQGKGFTISQEDKPLYHAAAVVASNYLVGIIYLATRMLEELGLENKQSIEALFPLIQGTINNIQREGPINALTGPAERGDGITLMKHINALNEMNMLHKNAYQVLGRLTVEIAAQKGSIDENKAAELTKILEGRYHE